VPLEELVAIRKKKKLGNRQLESQWMPICTMRKALKSLHPVVNEPDRDGAPSSAISPLPFKDSDELYMLETDLAYIHTNFYFLSSGTKMEQKTHLLSEVIKEINNTHDKLNRNSDSEADVMKQKFRTCSSRNKESKKSSTRFRV
jgi:hypothetical protein